MDGVIIEKEGKKIAVIDGTAPHTEDPVYGGACGEIINLGECWDPYVLEKRKEEIAKLVNKKRIYYSTAYRYLKAAENIALMQKELALYCCDREKMNKAAVLFFVINATSIQVIPTTILSLRQAYLSATPFDILLPSLIVSVSTTVIGFLIVKIFVK